ncbi:unnamed protein product [Acanthosepion pharaonis]|uniref:Transmembrane protein n=1 Tax=Acanthosepion pharaonis TaxID=158019 RepID=A0A812CMZ3_ACAPH|nr:unnamed protein product [Sepia pharaonis]
MDTNTKQYGESLQVTIYLQSSKRKSAVEDLSAKQYEENLESLFILLFFLHSSLFSVHSFFCLSFSLFLSPHFTFLSFCSILSSFIFFYFIILLSFINAFIHHPLFPSFLNFHSCRELFHSFLFPSILNFFIFVFLLCIILSFSRCVPASLSCTRRHQLKGTD